MTLRKGVEITKGDDSRAAQVLFGLVSKIEFCEGVGLCFIRVVHTIVRQLICFFIVPDASVALDLREVSRGRSLFEASGDGSQDVVMLVGSEAVGERQDVVDEKQACQGVGVQLQWLANLAKCKGEKNGQQLSAQDRAGASRK